MSTDEFTPSMGEVVGQNVSRLREKARLTQNDLVMRIFHRTGETWTRAQLSTIENGKRESVSLAELLVLACAFDVTIPDLFAGAGDAEDERHRVIRSGRFRITLGDLQSALTGGAVVVAAEDKAEAWTPVQIEADRAVADRLGVPTDVVVQASMRMWGHSLTEERDTRLGDTSTLPPRTLQAKRGAMTRVLTAQVKARLNIDEKIREIRSSK